jgi:uncharacterized protein
MFSSSRFTLTQSQGQSNQTVSQVQAPMFKSIDELRHYTVARNFPAPTSLQRALNRMQFVQADPIRSPARAQDLILRQRVRGYRAGDLERRYYSLDLEEDFFVNYGYVTRSLQTLMHPRSDARVPADDIGRPWPTSRRKQAKLILDFVRARGPVHPREVDDHFSHGKITNYWGGSSNATTHLLDAMHYRGMLRVVRRDKGIRIYAAHAHETPARNSADRNKRLDALVDVVVNNYAPLTTRSLSFYVRRLRFAVPQWQRFVGDALQRAKTRLQHLKLDGLDWYWPESESIQTTTSDLEMVRLLAPFDPLVHDRWRFELLWGWTYRFEAYTPVPKRKLGYYAMPMLWRDEVIGWANLSTKSGRLEHQLGYQKTMPRDRTFKRELEAELDRVRQFLGVTT